MTEISWPWTYLAGGDDGKYTADEWSDMWKIMFGQSLANAGVIPHYGAKLYATVNGTDIDVSTGAALVDGSFYRNDATVTFTPSVPVTSTRFDRIVLQKVWSTQTVRLAVISGVEGGSAPAFTQTDATRWEIPLWLYSITTGGVITLGDERKLLSYAGIPSLGSPDSSTLASGGSAIEADVFVEIDTEGAAATDNLDTLYAPVKTGDIVFLRGANAGRLVNLNDGAGNLGVMGPTVLSHKNITPLVWDGTQWVRLNGGFFVAKYDSGVFAGAGNTVITKAHGLPGIPLNVQVWFSTLASPTWYYRLTGVAYDSYGSPATPFSVRVQSDATNITIALPPWGFSAGYGPNNLRTDYTSGYYRIVAWL